MLTVDLYIFLFCQILNMAVKRILAMFFFIDSEQREAEIISFKVRLGQLVVNFVFVIRFVSAYTMNAA